MDWNIQPRSDSCQGCGRGFKSKDVFHTLLFEERHEFSRMDVCEQCWASQHSQSVSHRKGFVSHWQGVYTVPPPLPPDPIKKETAESILRKLVELGRPEHAAACFILAVMLEQKRLLKVKAQHIQDERRVFVYEHSKTGDLFTIPDPNLQIDQLDAVQRDVIRLLEHGVEEPKAQDAAAQQHGELQPEGPVDPVSANAPSPADSSPASEAPGAANALAPANP